MVRCSCGARGVVRLPLPDTDHYYLSQALLRRAVDGGDRDPVMRQILEFLRERPSAVLCPYDFEPEFQLLVIWLARMAGLEAEFESTPMIPAWPGGTESGCCIRRWNPR